MNWYEKNGYKVVGVKCPKCGADHIYEVHRELEIEGMLYQRTYWGCNHCTWGSSS